MRLCDLESGGQSIRKKEGVSIPIQLHYISIPAATHAKASVDVAIVRPAPLLNLWRATVEFFDCNG